MFGDPSARGVPLEDPPNNECSGVAAQSGAVRFDHVRIVVLSAEDKTAVVTYDDRKAQVDALVKATTNAGYPSEPKG